MKLKKIEISKNVKRIEAEPNKTWDMDKKSFVLIKINPENNKLEVGICNYKDYTIDYIITGDDPESIYQTIIRNDLIDKKSHAAYLGRELEKADICRKLGISYIQDDEINIKEIINSTSTNSESHKRKNKVKESKSK